MAREVKLNINKFLGLWHDDAGDTNILNGAFAQLQNFQMLPSFKMRKRSGYSSMIAERFNTPIKGQWYGKLNGKYFHIVATGGKAYVIKDRDVLPIGELADAPTNMFQFGEAIYIQDGTNYKKFTGIELIDESEVNFNSAEYTGTYPKTLTVPKGKYRFKLGGGKGKEAKLGNFSARGGRGGKIEFTLDLAESSGVEIRKITNNGEYGASYWVFVNGELYAAVGGGGGPGWGMRDGEYVEDNSGGNGGSDSGEDGEGGKGTGGLGARSGAGGKASNSSGLYQRGKDGYDFNDTAKPGHGGSGATSESYGGCGYAGGGGGSWYSGTRWDYIGSGGGGSSFVKAEGVSLHENSQGTNDGMGYISINTVREYLSLEDPTYTPLVYAGTKPDGTNAEAIEPINMLSQQRRQQFNGDNEATKFKLVEKDNFSVDKVIVDGEKKVITTHYTVNAKKDEITFITKPPTGANNVEIWYTHSSENPDTEEVAKQTRSRIYGGKNDSRVFLYGNGNRIIFSDLADGIPSAEYFPVFNTMDIGTTQHDVTGLSVQYDRMLIHKEVGTWWTHYDYNEDLMAANFPVYPLNDNIGCSYMGVEQICQNNPFVLQGKQLWQFIASNVRDERNVVYMSERVQKLLDEIDFSGVVTVDYEKYGEYWIVNGNKAYIFNYRMGVWFYYFFADNVTAITLIDNNVVLGTDKGDLLIMDGSLDDNGELINAFAETGWIDYGYSHIRKFLNFMWIQIFPESKTSAEIYYEIDRGSPRLVKEISYENLNFTDVDFSDFSFMTNYNPKSFRLKPKAKKFVYIKFSIINNKRNKLTLLGLVAPALLGGQSK